MPQTPAKRGRKRKSEAPEATPDVDESAKSKKRKSNGTTSATKPAILDYKLPIGSWEDDIESIDSIAEKLVAGKTKNAKPTKELYVLAIWNNGARFEHSVETIRQKCPQKVCCRHTTLIAETLTEPPASRLSFIQSVCR